MTLLSSYDAAAVQRRTVRALVLTQAVGALGITIGLATASLLARALSGSDSMAGLAQTTQVLGTAVGGYVLAQLMSARGRRVGLVTGMVVAAFGALLCVLAGAVGSMFLLLVGTTLLGAMSAANAAARYAATDLSAPAHRARDLSVVVWAGTIGAVLGPNLAGPSGALALGLGLPALTGPFLVGALGMAVAAVLAAVLLRPDPLLLARSLDGSAGAVRRGTAWARAVAVVREDPVVGLAVAGVAAAHAVMIGVMVMTPLHLEHGGAHLHVIGFVISVHVLGMFAFSPLVGWLADAMGRAVVLALGGVILVVALVLSGASPQGSSWQIFAGLYLLGLGWSFAMVAGSTLLTERTPLAARTDVQGASDLVMGLTAAAAGGLSGIVVGLGSFAWLNVLAGVLAAVVLAAGIAAHRGATSRDSVPAQ